MISASAFAAVCVRQLMAIEPTPRVGIAIGVEQLDTAIKLAHASLIDGVIAIGIDSDDVVTAVETFLRTGAPSDLSEALSAVIDRAADHFGHHTKNVPIGAPS